MTEVLPKMTPEIKRIPEMVTRKLLIVEGRSEIKQADYDPFLVRNQAQFGKGEDDYAAMVQVHQNNMSVLNSHVLGVTEQKREAFKQVAPDGTKKTFIEDPPRTVNYWVGEHVKLLTPEEAEAIPFAGQNGLYWATQGAKGEKPELVVRANNGYFYPAKKGDFIIIPPKTADK
jgi:hypothetical protein